MNLISALTERRFGEGFEVSYSLRSGDGAGTHGVRKTEIADCYAESVGRAIAFLVGEPVRMPAPPRPIPVYVFEIGEVFSSGAGPFTDSDRNGDPYISLPCRTDAPTWDEEFRHAAAAAAHETFHAIAWKTRPLRDLVSQPWRWFHEGCAVWTEMRVLPHNADYLRFGMNWCDRPHVPLDHEDMLYESGFFVQYLSNRFSPAIVGNIWRSDPELREGPFDAIARLSGCAWDTLFRDYCRDAFFLNDPRSHAYAPRVYERFCGRALRGSASVQRGERVLFPGRLRHLACHYFRIVSAGKPGVKLAAPAGAIAAEVVPMRSSGDEWLAVVSNSALKGDPAGESFELEVSGG